MARTAKKLLERILAALKRTAEPGHPDDPYALVGAPKKPRPPLRGAAAALDEPKS